MPVKPLVVILCLQSEKVLDQYHPDIIPALAQKSVVRKAKTLPRTRRYLNSTARPHAVIVIDAAVTYSENYELLPQLVDSDVLYPDLKTMFKNVCGLPWRVCAYTSGDHVVNSRVNGIAPKAIVEKCYVKSTRINSVSLEDAIYVSPSEAKKLRKPQEGLPDKTYETFAAIAKVGRGRVGYMGHFSPEPITANVLLGMCFWPDARAPVAPGDGLPEVFHTGLAFVEEDIPQGTSASDDAGRSKRNILIISTERSEHMDDLYPQFYKALRKTATVTEVQEACATQAALSATPHPDAVILSDSALAKPKNSKLLTKLVAYARAGGTVVLALQFSNTVKVGEMRSFFAAWGVP